MTECPECGADLRDVRTAEHFREFHTAADFLEGST